MTRATTLLDIKPHRRRACARLVACAVALGLANAAVIFAHPVSLSRARVIVHPDHVDVMIEAPAEDLLHYGLLEPRDNSHYSKDTIERAAPRYCEKLRDGLALRDKSGALLQGAIESCIVTREGGDAPETDKLTTYWIGATFRYASRPGQSLDFLTFQHNADPATTQILLTRMGTTIRQADHSESPREIVLTSGGNAETLEFDWSPEAPSQRNAKAPIGRRDARSWLADERFRTIHAIMDTDDRGVVLRVVVPAPIAETWQPIRRERRDFLTQKEQALVAEDWAMRFSKRIECRIDSHDSTINVEGVVLMGPASSEQSILKSTGPIGFYSARIVGCLRLSNKACRAADISWKLFNEAVPSAKLLVLSGNEATEFPISTYDPVVRWRVDD